MKVQILYEDADILVCVKPAGTASQTKRIGEQDMVSLLKNYRAQKGEDPYLGLVHRLDQPVEGIMVFGKNPESAAGLNQQLETGDFGKIYLAIAQGILPDAEGKLENYIKKDGRKNLSMVVPKGEPGAKRAVLEYQVLQVDQRQSRSLVRIRLQTGRHHQIRVQMAHLGTPLVGDMRYGKEKKAGQALALCACELNFRHPKTQKELRFQIEPSWREQDEQDIDY